MEHPKERVGCAESAGGARGEPKRNNTGTLATTIGSDNPFRYRGYYYDSETGLYYLNQRYYNPEWGRFVNADSYMGQTGRLGSHNVYAYCGNNPVIREDPDGDVFNFIASLVGTVVGGAIGFVSNGIGNLAEGKDFTDNWVSATIGGAVSGAVAGLTCGASLVVSAAVSSAAGSIAEEAVNYIGGKKELTWENIDRSAQKVAVDTAFGTAFAYAGGRIAKSLYPSVSSSTGTYSRVATRINDKILPRYRTFAGVLIGDGVYNTIKNIYRPSPAR